jgi:hypothetical protein
MASGKNRNRMRRKFVLVIAALALFHAGAHAQDAFFAFHGAFVDVPVSQPCGANGLKGSASMTVYDHSAWLVYTCNDDRVILRRYFNANDNVIAPSSPVQAPPAPTAAPVPMGMISCPADPHPACSKLPHGVYDRAWADTVAR